MTELTCERCGTAFTTDRDGVMPGQDTTRCPSCGKKHPLSDGGGGDGADATRITSDGPVTVTITIEIDAGE